MNYSVIIRTLGKAGEAYQKTLDSIRAQTIAPESIFVYIAEGFAIPSETIGIEQYIYVPKGMVAQRALQYAEVKTEYCLFLDDDVYLPDNAVEKMYKEMTNQTAQVISPCTFENHKVSIVSKLRLSFLGKEVCRLRRDNRWAFKVLRTSGFSYNNNPNKPVYESQTNAGPCFFCRKEDFLSIKYDEELWLDKTYYALPDDQVMFYKMYKLGLKILTTYDTGIIHLDAGSTIGTTNEKVQRVIFSEYRNKLIFWHRFIYLPETRVILRAWSILCILYSYLLQALKSIAYIICGRRGESMAFWNGLRAGLTFIRTEEYKSLPRI